MELIFKEITEKEIAGVLEMMAEFNAIDHYPFDVEKTNKNLLHLVLNDSLGKGWMLEADLHVCGYVILTYGYSFEHNGKDGLIDELYLKSEFRGQGLGKQTMEFIEKEAFRLGVNVLHLEVEPHNIGGTELYRKNGYKDAGRILLSKKIVKS